MMTMQEIYELESRPSFLNGLHSTRTLWFTVLGISCGSFVYGYNLAVLNGPHTLFKDFMNETSHGTRGDYLSEEWLTIYWSTIVAIFSLGGAIGAAVAGWWAYVFGRKRGCLLNSMLGYIAIVLLILSPTFQSFHSLIAGRFLIGVNAGLYTMPCPLYLNEISTPELRGPLGIMHQTGTVLGILVAQILGFPIFFGVGDRWIALLGFPVVPLLVQLSCLSVSPESPCYLAKVLGDTGATRQGNVSMWGVQRDEKLTQTWIRCCVEEKTKRRL